MRFQYLTMCAVSASLTICTLAQAQTTVSGAGSTLARSLIAQWAKDNSIATQFRINYEAIGSSNGLKAISEKVSEFAISDIALNKPALAQKGLAQMPLAASAVAIAYNLPELNNSQIQLSGDLLAEIYMGNITKWNDASIAIANPGIK